MAANAEVVRRAWDAFSQRDLDTATADVDGSAEIVVPDSLPWGGTHRGPDGFKSMVAQFMSHLEDFRPIPRGFLESGDQVVVPVDVTGRTTAGNDLSGSALWLYQLRDGKIVRAELYADTAKTMQALG